MFIYDQTSKLKVKAENEFTTFSLKMLENRLESNVNLNSVICELEKSEKLFIEQLSKYEDFTMDKFVEDVERRRY